MKRNSKIQEAVDWLNQRTGQMVSADELKDAIGCSITYAGDILRAASLNGNGDAKKYKNVKVYQIKTALDPIQMSITVNPVKLSHDIPMATTSNIPGYIFQRMQSDDWSYGLRMSNGMIIGISRIVEIMRDSTGNLWIDVEMLDEEPMEYKGKGLVISPTPRTMATLQVSHIIAAFELAST